MLDKKFKKNKFVVTILYGRRRIGKTRLVNKFISEHNCKYVSFTAVERGEHELLSMLTESMLASLAPELVGEIRFYSLKIV